MANSVTDVYFMPDGGVTTFAAAVKSRRWKNRGQVIAQPRKIPMLSGSYREVKFKLIPAINSCNPNLHGIDVAVAQLEKDMKRFCVLRRKKSRNDPEQVEEENTATQTATAMMPPTS